MAVLRYQGHGSYRITCASGMVIYVDPYMGEGYDVPADLILVTHDHYDHTAVDKMPHAPGCVIIRYCDALENGVYKSFDVGGVHIRAVQAYNKNHDRRACVGYVLELDGVKLYAAGDTSETEDMRNLLPGMKLDYALLPGDGVFNMDVEEASRCAKIIGARHSIPIHLWPDHTFDEAKASRFTCPGKLVLRPGDELELVSE
jgi:L-ascorbate metabolism protein UlaG (beta-lactamase superfamily)